MIPSAEINLYSLAADLVLAGHFAYVAFVVVGLALVWIGYFLRWRFVRSFSFRAAHLLSMAIVVLESVFGITCPLTTWEHDLRVRAGGGGEYPESFLEHWIHQIMFFRLPTWAFTLIYIVFFLLLLLSFIIVRPAWPGRPGVRGSESKLTKENP